jgi:acyl-coenzyme A synthetase/AMP-(fatty) acid ligase
MADMSVPAINHPAPLHALLDTRRALAQPVCHDGGRYIDWEEFRARVRQRARGVAGSGGERWLLVSESPLEFVIWLLAVLHAGKTVVVPPNTQPSTIARLERFFDTVAELEAVSDTSPDAPLTALQPRAALIDLYTSGSTGEPKRVRKTLACFEAEIETLEKLWGATLGTATVVATVPHQHIYGLLFRLLWPLAAGRCFDAVTCATPDTLQQRLVALRGHRPGVESGAACAPAGPDHPRLAATAAAHVLLLGWPAAGRCGRRIHTSVWSGADRSLRQHRNRGSRLAQTGKRRRLDTVAGSQG